MPTCENIPLPILSPADSYLCKRVFVGGFLTVLDNNILDSGMSTPATARYGWLTQKIEVDRLKILGFKLSLCSGTRSRSAILLTCDSYRLGVDPAGRLGTVVGWGRTSEGGALPAIAHEVQVPILSLQQCRQTKYRASRITANMLCAGKGTMDSCQVSVNTGTYVYEPEKILQLYFRRKVGRKHAINYVNFLGVCYSVMW